MKYLLSLVLITTALFSRDNPFVPTQTFVDEKESILETSSIDNTKNIVVKKIEIKKQKDSSKIVIINDTNDDEDIMVQSKAIKERKSSKIIVKPKNIQNNIQKDTQKTDTKTAKIEVQTPQIDSTPTSIINQLPYLKVTQYKDALVVSSPYKIMKKFMIYNPYKIAIDFKAKVPEKSQVIRLDNPLFEKIVFGNHPKKGFFRIVMYPKEDPHNYIRTYTDYTITMKKK